eukprot:1890778-Amphidinium_carterae.2
MGVMGYLDYIEASSDASVSVPAKTFSELGIAPGAEIVFVITPIHISTSRDSNSGTDSALVCLVKSPSGTSGDGTSNDTSGEDDGAAAASTQTEETIEELHSTKHRPQELQSL